MFSFLKGSSSGVKVADKIWMSRQAKWNACASMLQASPNCLFIAWFENTFSELQSFLNLAVGDDHLVLAKDVGEGNVVERLIIFIEHYPLLRVEQALFEKLKMEEVPVLSSMDEPLFQLFGGERTIELMKKLGVKEDEVIGHSMVSKSISRAQKKIAEKAISDIAVSSQEEWFSRNMRK